MTQELRQPEDIPAGFSPVPADKLDQMVEPIAYRLHDDNIAGIVTTDLETGHQLTGREAIISLAATRMAGKRLDFPPEKRPGITLIDHETGNYDTGTRALRNLARVAMGRPPKLYRRTRVPVRR